MLAKKNYRFCRFDFFGLGARGFAEIKEGLWEITTKAEMKGEARADAGHYGETMHH